jgi:hypothetical protein
VIRHEAESGSRLGRSLQKKGPGSTIVTLRGRTTPVTFAASRPEREPSSVSRRILYVAGAQTTWLRVRYSGYLIGRNEVAQLTVHIRAPT